MLCSFTKNLNYFLDNVPNYIPSWVHYLKEIGTTTVDDIF